MPFFPKPVPVNTAANFSTGIFCHEALSQTTGFSPVPSPSAETFATQKWTYGYYLNKNKLTQTVTHWGFSIVQKGHNCGPMIPDLTAVAPGNYLYPLIWPFSSRKIVFSASKVKMDGKATGCACTYAIPPLPMMTCGYPTSAAAAYVHPVQYFMVNVNVGMTWSDFLWGIAKVWREVLTNLLFDQMFGKYFSDPPPGLLGKLRKRVQDSMGLSPEGASRRALHSMTEGALSLFTDNPTIEYGLGSPAANANVGLSEKEGFYAEGSAMGQEGSVGKSSGGEAPAGEGASSGAGGSSFGEALP